MGSAGETYKFRDKPRASFQRQLVHFGLIFLDCGHGCGFAGQSERCYEVELGRELYCLLLGDAKLPILVARGLEGRKGGGKRAVPHTFRRLQLGI